MGEPLHDEATLHWHFLEEAADPCLVVSERMEFIYVNQAAGGLVPDEWFGKRCFEVLPVADEACAFHCPKIDAVAEGTADGPAVAYCEETLYGSHLERVVLGIGLIPLAADRPDRARAVFVLRRKQGEGDATAFESALLEDAQRIRRVILERAG